MVEVSVTVVQIDVVDLCCAPLGSYVVGMCGIIDQISVAWVIATGTVRVIWHYWFTLLERRDDCSSAIIPESEFATMPARTVAAPVVVGSYRR